MNERWKQHLHQAMRCRSIDGKSVKLPQTGLHWTVSQTFPHQTMHLAEQYKHPLEIKFIIPFEVQIQEQPNKRWRPSYLAIFVRQLTRTHHNSLTAVFFTQDNEHPTNCNISQTRHKETVCIDRPRHHRDLQWGLGAAAVAIGSNNEQSNSLVQHLASQANPPPLRRTFQELQQAILPGNPSSG